MKHCRQEQIDAVILNLDFQKCFDMISKSAIIGSLHFFDFGEFIINWVSILYNNFKVKVQNNGHFSEYIEINRGVHQGGCCSVNIFFSNR